MRYGYTQPIGLYVWMIPCLSPVFVLSVCRASLFVGRFLFFSLFGDFSFPTPKSDPNPNTPHKNNQYNNNKHPTHMHLERVNCILSFPPVFVSLPLFFGFVSVVFSCSRVSAADLAERYIDQTSTRLHCEATQTQPHKEKEGRHEADSQNNTNKYER